MLNFQVVPDGIRNRQSVRVQQGQVYVGIEPQQTYLGSCVCVGFFCARHSLGATSHITGFSKNAGHSAQGALEEIERRLALRGLRLERCECFVIGGSDSARHVYDSVTEELHHHNLRFRELDVLGAFHRKLELDPVGGTLVLFKKALRRPWSVTPSAGNANPRVHRRSRG